MSKDFWYATRSIIRECQVTGMFTKKIDGNKIPCYTLRWSDGGGPNWLTQGALINYSQSGIRPTEPYKLE